MKEKKISITLDKRLLEAIDGLVEQSVYRDRDEAIRIAIAEKLYHLRRAGNDTSGGEKQSEGWPDYLEDLFGGPSV